MITLLIIAPIAGALIVGSLPERFARGTALSFTAVTAILVALIWQRFDQSAAGLQLIERHVWIPAIGAEYVVGVDGFSLLLLILTSLVFPFALAANRGSRGFFALMLLMQSALYGTFVAQNFILWFLFFEMGLVPGFLLIKIFGAENREYAATKFFLYTFVGSLTMLLAFLGIYFVRGTFDFAQLAAIGKAGSIGGNLTWLIFAGIFFGLAVKVPLFPFHTWLPDAYQTAPTGVSMVFTGVLSKMGVYGFVRLLLPLFPVELRIISPWLLSLAVCSIVFAALAAWAQRDLKRMVGYLSINHLGYCMLALFALNPASNLRVAGEDQMALSGVFMQVFNHGITAAALFYFVGLLEQRRGARCLGDFGGLMQRTPLLCGWMSVAMFSSLGLPGLNGFIGEFLIFRGSLAPGLAYVAIAVAGLLITAIVLLRAMQALFSGPLVETCSTFPDLLWSEKLVIIPVTLLMFAIGIAPQFLFNIFNATVVHLARSFA
jgi:NADH-quinone oxidoreductase subunit M